MLFEFAIKNIIFDDLQCKILKWTQICSIHLTQLG